MNTKIEYMYRDSNNFKKTETIIVRGELTFAQIANHLTEGGGFTPEDVGLPHPGEKLPTFPDDSDHPWCELTSEDITPTKKPPTIDMSATELLDLLIQAAEAGWPADNDEKYKK